MLSFFYCFSASVVQMFAGVIGVIVRSILSKLVGMQEAGTAFVVAGIIESVIPIGSSSLYGLIYSETVSTMPNLVFFVTIAASATVFILSV